MGWKKWPYWLKGGIILVVVFIILMIIEGLVFGGWLNNYSPYSTSIKLVTNFPGQMVIGIFSNSYLGCLYDPDIAQSPCPSRLLLESLAYLMTLIIYILLGIIFGLIYGKIKKK